MPSTYLFAMRTGEGEGSNAAGIAGWGSQPSRPEGHYLHSRTIPIQHTTSSGLDRLLQTLRSRPNSATGIPKAVWYTRAMRQPSRNQTRRVLMTGIRRTAEKVSPQGDDRSFPPSAQRAPIVPTTRRSVTAG